MKTKTKHYKASCKDGVCTIETRNPDARHQIDSWGGAGMAGLDAIDASFYGHDHVGSGRLPRNAPKGHTAVDYELTTWKLSKAAVHRLATNIRIHLGDKNYYSKAEIPMARELLGLLEKLS